MIRYPKHNQWGEFTLKHYINSHPYINPDDIEYWSSVTVYDIFIKFKNGKKYIYQIYDEYERETTRYTIPLTDYEIKKEFQLRLKRFMRLSGATQETLAMDTGIGKRTITRYWAGESIPDIISLQHIAHVLDVDPGDFFYREY